jgi:23S rRNA G2445 N2-methylase RlmL
VAQIIRSRTNANAIPTTGNINAPTTSARSPHNNNNDNDKSIYEDGANDATINMNDIDHQSKRQGHRQALHSINNTSTSTSTNNNNNNGEPIIVWVDMHDDVCDIMIDTSGNDLHRRGYRLAVGKAPLRETLASSLLFIAGYDHRLPLIDPMCGSGTFPIEGMSSSR